MPIEGFEKVIAELKAMAVRADGTGQRVVVRSQIVFERDVKSHFSNAHKRGTPTPSRPGEPPATVTGTLRRGIVADTPHIVGLGTWSGSVFPTSVYARIQELGGVAGRNRATQIPARPYMRPALVRVTPRLAQIHVEEFGRVIGV